MVDAAGAGGRGCERLPSAGALPRSASLVGVVLASACSAEWVGWRSLLMRHFMPGGGARSCRGWGRPGYGVVRGADIARTYRNAAFRGGALTAPYNGFAGPHTRFQWPAVQLTNATVFHGQIPVAATRTSFLYSNRQAFSNPGLAAARNRPFFRSPQQVRGGFAPASSQSYASRQGGYSSPSQARPSSSGSSGWTRFGDPRGSAASRQSFTGGSEQSGWHSFGEPSPSQAYRNGSQRSYQSPSPNPSARQGFSAPRSTPNYSAPRYLAPHYSAPQRAPQQHYSAPRSSPPSHSGGGGGGGSHGGGGGHGHR